MRNGGWQPVEVVDGHVRERAVVPIDAPHNLVHHAPQPLHNQQSSLLDSHVCASQDRRT